MFESNWPAPNRDGAAEMGRKLGADLVLYAVIPVGTRLQSVPHIAYEPGQSYSGTTSGVVGGVLGHSKPMDLRRVAFIRNTRLRRSGVTLTSSAI